MHFKDGQSTEETEMRRAFTYVQTGVSAYLEDVTLEAVELGNPGAWRRR
jgi:hypothetical protein